MKKTITDYSNEMQYLNETIISFSKSGDNDFVAVYEEKLKQAEIMLITELAKEVELGGDVTLIMYRTTNFVIVTPQIAKQLLNNK
jgi:hypothetical protein